MSASPAGAPFEPNSTTPNGGAVPPRRKKPVNPLVSKKSTVRKPPRQATPSTVVNGVSGTPNGGAQHAPLRQSAGPQTVQDKYGPLPDMDVGGTHDVPDVGGYTDYPIVMTKKSMMEGLRHHAMRFATKEEIRPYDESKFTRPIRLHRRDPRARPDKHIDPTLDPTMDDKEREKQEILKAQRQAQREANQAQMAPVQKAAASQVKRTPFQKKTEQVYRTDDTPESKKWMLLRYEEGRPWHLEDFDNKNTWVGTYEEALSECHVMFVIEDGSFRMVPIEKWYKFSAVGRVKNSLTIDEAEARMSMKTKDTRWFMDTQKANEEKRREQAIRIRTMNKARQGMRGEGKMEGDEEDRERPDLAEDVDDIDYDHNEDFQDDDQDRLFEGDDEDAKDAEERIKREQQQANIFAGTGVKEDKDWDEEEEIAKRKAAERRKKEKKVRKNLIKREKKYEYDSEEESNDYTEESESEDSETERRKEDERKKEEERKEAEKSKSGDKIPSGASSKGTNTPSGRSEKRSDPSKPKHSSTSLKRPGSPNLSEASGTESSRKKQKKKHPLDRPSNSGSAPPSRAMSPEGTSKAPSLSRKSSVVEFNLDPKKLTQIFSAAPRPDRLQPGMAGSGSDTETDGGKRKRKLKLKVKTPANGSPNGSRAGSPDNAGISGGSRATSPAAAAPPKKLPMPSVEEVAQYIPAEGTTLAHLIKIFKGRMHDRGAFVSVVKMCTRFDHATKKLFPKGTPGTAGPPLDPAA
ncbi:hypothetical protein B0A49_07017 [Cryomyces minteri]|uniref:Uncharacterized protein n=1 Tax=Cryomyces minteri TaxID=331657 RepID=A0A4U0X8Z6_9PEZI|nr:hypothetical protein B0A49_07017 [Cryomyces minteri]